MLFSSGEACITRFYLAKQGGGATHGLLKAGGTEGLDLISTPFQHTPVTAFWSGLPVMPEASFCGF